MWGILKISIFKARRKKLHMEPISLITLHFAWIVILPAIGQNFLGHWCPGLREKAVSGLIRKWDSPASFIQKILPLQILRIGPTEKFSVPSLLALIRMEMHFFQ